MTERLGAYELTGHLTSQNSGYSVWGFGKRDGKDYFIKQFLSPKFPANDTVASLEQLARKQRRCQQFEEKKTALYQALNENSDGCAVRVEAFFRVDSKYYISMRKIQALPWDVGAVAVLPEEEKRFLCGVIAHGVAALHKGRIVHADLKHENILFMRTASGGVTAKIIDFDSGFLETDPPAEGEEIVGDQIYFSPEACLTFCGERPELSCKMDIFALGILFHQYFAGKLPAYDEEQFFCAGDAVARGQILGISPELPEDLQSLLTWMLSADPHMRPEAIEVWQALMAVQKAPMEEVLEEKKGTTEEAPIMPPAAQATPAFSDPFFRPGDLC